MSKAKIVLSAAASLAASAMLIRSLADDFIPIEIQNYFRSGLQRVSKYISSELTIVIEEFKGFNTNQVFEAAHLYLGARTTTNTSTQRLRVGKTEKEKTLEVTLDRNEEIVDVYKNVKLKWRFFCTEVRASKNRNSHLGDHNTSMESEVRHYELCFHKKHKDMVLNSYLFHVLEKAKAIKKKSTMIKLHTAELDGWDANDTVLEHPMTFNTLALDSELKRAIMEDLNNFMNGKEYYERTGRSWKRGYLLYGPPGTGKSSLIAAMANHLKFDIYDLDLTDIDSNSDLRFLLLRMPSQSILVIEDIDCSIKLENRESEDKDNAQNRRNHKVTLSGLLNFIDGLWSCCGEQRIIIFTTNHKEKLDPALLRPGRMDMHIHMSYCTASVFRQLALNYLGISSHHLFVEVEKIIMEVKVTPAEVAGELTKSTDADISLPGLVKFLHAKMTKQDTEKLT